MLLLAAPGAARRFLATLRVSANALMLIAILAVGAYVRLADIDLGWFMLDQARDVRTARAIVEGRAFPLVGPAVEGGPSHTWGPLYFYLIAVPLAFSPDPTVAAAFLGLLNLLAVYLTYRLGAAFFGRDIGLIAAALFATYPLAVINARALWNIAPVPLIAVLFFACLFTLIVRRRSIMAVPALLTLALAPQLHLSGLAFGVVFAAALLIYRPPLATRHLLLGGGAALLALLPYSMAVVSGAGEGMRTTLVDLLARLAPRHPAEIADMVRRVFFAAWDGALWMTRRFGGDGGVADWTLVSWAESGLILLGAVYPLRRLVRAWARGESAAQRDGLLLLWIWIPLALLSFKRGTLSHFYFDVLYPGAFIAAATPLAALVAAARRRGAGSGARILAGAVAAFVILIMGSQVALLNRLHAVTVARGRIPVPSQLLTWGLPIALPDGDTMPMRYRRGIVTSTIAHLGADRDTFVRRVHGMAFEEVLQDKGVFFDWLARRAALRPHAVPAGRHVAVIRTEALREATGRFTRRLGPFSVVAYTPLIDYSSWEFAQGGTLERTGRPATAWTPLYLPTRQAPNDADPGYPPLFPWPGMPILVRGALVAPSRPASTDLVVSLVDRPGGEHWVEACRLDATPLAPGGTSRFYTPVAVTSEVVFDLSPHLRAGRRTITCSIAGRGAAFDLDVYEIRRPRLPVGTAAGDAPFATALR